MDFKHEIIEDDFKFKAPFTCVLVGSSNSGKTTTQLKFLEHHKRLMDKEPSAVLYIYNDWQPEFSKYSSMATFLKGWDHEQLQPEALLQQRDILFLVDDSGDTTVQKDFLKQIFCKYSHHKVSESEREKALIHMSMRQ